MGTTAKKSNMDLLVPGILAVAGFGMMIYGFIGESWWIGLGSVIFASALLAGMFMWGAARSIMTSSDNKPQFLSKLPDEASRSPYRVNTA